MKVVIKSFQVEREVKNEGIKFDVFEPNGGDRLGDCILTKSGLVWCKGKTSRTNGVTVSCKDRIAWMEAEEG